MLHHWPTYYIFKGKREILQGLPAAHAIIILIPSLRKRQIRARLSSDWQQQVQHRTIFTLLTRTSLEIRAPARIDLPILSTPIFHSPQESSHRIWKRSGSPETRGSWRETRSDSSGQGRAKPGQNVCQEGLQGAAAAGLFTSITQGHFGSPTTSSGAKKLPLLST